MNLNKNSYFIFDQDRSNSKKENIKNAVFYIISLIEKKWIQIFHPCSKIDKKYRVTLGAIFKNEATYLKEWIEFHRIVGVEHFYLYNNCSSLQLLSRLFIAPGQCLQGFEQSA